MAGRILVEDFLFDEDNIEKIANHGLTPRQVRQVLSNRPRLITRNRAQRRASHVLIGRDDAGLCIAIPIEATRQSGLWRPVTAWRCKLAEEARLRQIRWRE